MNANNRMLLRNKHKIENNKEKSTSTTPSLNDLSNSHLEDRTTHALENVNNTKTDELNKLSFKMFFIHLKLKIIKDCDDQPLKKRLRSGEKEMACGEETSGAIPTLNSQSSKINPGDLVWSKVMPFNLS